MEPEVITNSDLLNKLVVQSHILENLARQINAQDKESMLVTIIKRLEKYACSHALLVEMLLDDNIFPETGKHNLWWTSEHEEESIKLHDLRLKIQFIHDRLWDIKGMTDEKN